MRLYFQAIRYVDGGQRSLYRTLGSAGHPMPHLTVSDDGDALSVRSGPARCSMRLASKQDHQVQAGPGILSRALFF